MNGREQVQKITPDERHYSILELAAEWAQVRDREHARKLEELEGWVRSVRHELGPSEAAA